MTTRLYRTGLSHRAAGIAAAVACLGFVGCGSGIKTVPVAGRVTFSGNPPPYGCVLNFLPDRAELKTSTEEVPAMGLANGCGECDPTGAFKAACLRNRGGLMPGRYQVMVSCYVYNETPNAPPVSVVPPDFKAPELVVPADARSVRYDVDVPAPSRKPSG